MVKISYVKVIGICMERGGGPAENRRAGRRRVRPIDRRRRDFSTTFAFVNNMR
jgi:hypothetical protein